MTVAAPHRFRRMAHELVNDTLIDARSREVASEGVPVRVKADLEPALGTLQAPGRPAQRLPEQLVRFSRRQRIKPTLFADHELAARTLASPILQDGL